MTYEIRPARAEDHAAIASFTEATFDWGDYVADAFEQWLADPHGLVVVAADPADRAVAVSKATMVSDTEAWFQGARVHPEWRRRGIANAMANTMAEWARSRGARVVRLLVEDWNDIAQRQVEAGGFRAVGSWAVAERTIGAASPVPSGNGGRRVPALEQLVRAPSAEAESGPESASASASASASDSDSGSDSASDSAYHRIWRPAIPTAGRCCC